MKSRFSSKTIIGIIIASASIIIGQIARQTGAPMTEAEATEVLTEATPLIEQIVNIAKNLVDSVVALVGLYLAYRGRMNPEIKPLAAPVAPAAPK